MFSRLILAFGLTALASSPALAVPVQYGVGAAFRFGSFAGFTSNGASLDLRLGKIGLQGTVMQGDQDIESELGYSFFGIFSSPSGDYTIEKATIHQQGVAAQLKFHPMNGSFYFGFGAGRTVGTAKLEATGSTPGETLDEKLVVTRDLSTLSIGNVWTPGGIMIGCEWGAIVGASNVTTKETSASNAGSNADLVDLKESFADKVMEHSGRSTSHTLLGYLGFMLGS